MERSLQVISLTLLPLALLFAAAITMHKVGTAQSFTCSGQNRCEPFNSNGGGGQCVHLFCTESQNLANCDIQKCVAIPTSCGTGSHYEQDMITCITNNQSAHTSYYCASSAGVKLESCV
jgi:hypothetical protein